MSNFIFNYLIIFICAIKMFKFVQTSSYKLNICTKLINVQLTLNLILQVIKLLYKE